MQQIINFILENTKNYIDLKDKKSIKEKSQFFTPYKVAKYMGNLIVNGNNEVNILDPGAGTGLLTLAVVEQLLEKRFAKRITVDLFENDLDLIPLLNENMQLIQKYCFNQNTSFIYRVINENFITYKQSWDKASDIKYDIIISNPPYRKLRNSSEEAKVMNEIIFGQCNIYYLFLAKAITLLRDSGELVFILPRSFLSGEYFKKFRKWMLENVSIEHIHHFQSRYNVFRGQIIQEIVIIKLVKNERNELIKITSCNTSELDNFTSIDVPTNIVVENSESKRIRVPRSYEDLILMNKFGQWKHKLSDYGMSFCTGPIVDFRVKSFLQKQQSKNTVPLIWSCNFNEKTISWPKLNEKFSQCIIVNEKTANRLLPNQNYVLVKRVLTREGRKRVKANFYTKQGDFKYIGIENHINYLKYPDNIDQNILKGIWSLFNSCDFENYVRIFNGTTQLNASELNNIPIPSIEELRIIGSKINFEEDM